MRVRVASQAAEVKMIEVQRPVLLPFLFAVCSFAPFALSMQEIVAIRGVAPSRESRRGA